MYRIAGFALLLACAGCGPTTVKHEHTIRIETDNNQPAYDRSPEELATLKRHNDIMEDLQNRDGEAIDSGSRELRHAFTELVVMETRIRNNEGRDAAVKWLEEHFVGKTNDELIKAFPVRLIPPE